MKKKLLIILFSVNIMLTGCDSILVEDETEESITENSTIEESTSVEVSVEEITISAEPNTSARLDQILLKAKRDAENASEEEATILWEESFAYLKEHMNNFYENNEVMEKSMYYGAFIYQYIEANANATDISELEDSTRAAYEAGYNTVHAIKYVYRNAASVDDEDTQNALKEATDNLSKFE